MDDKRRVTEDTVAEHVRALISRTGVDVREAYVTHETSNRVRKPVIFIELVSGQRFKLTVDDITEPQGS